MYTYVPQQRIRIYTQQQLAQGLLDSVFPFSLSRAAGKESGRSLLLVVINQLNPLDDNGMKWRKSLALREGKKYTF